MNPEFNKAFAAEKEVRAKQEISDRLIRLERKVDQLIEAVAELSQPPTRAPRKKAVGE